MSLRRWQLVSLALGVAAAGFLPTLAFSSPRSLEATTTIGLVIGTQTTALSAAQLEATVYHLAGSKLKGATIVMTVDGKTTTVGTAAAYKAFIVKAHQNAAASIIRGILPDVESYFADNVGTRNDPDRNPLTRGYAGMTAAILRHRYDEGLSLNHSTVVRASSRSYCVQGTVQNEAAFKNGPSAPIKIGRC
jgi:hypothetical protein